MSRHPLSTAPASIQGLPSLRLTSHYFGAEFWNWASQNTCATHSLQWGRGWHAHKGSAWHWPLAAPLSPLALPCHHCPRSWPCDSPQLTGSGPELAGSTPAKAACMHFSRCPMANFVTTAQRLLPFCVKHSMKQTHLLLHWCLGEKQLTCYHLLSGSSPCPCPAPALQSPHRWQGDVSGVSA